MTAARRLHPASMVLDSIRKVPSTLLGIPAILAVANGRGTMILAGFAVLGVGSLVLAWLRWRRFTYAIADDALVIEQGLLHRHRRAIPLERIQDVSIEQGPLARILGLATVRIESGGGEKDEGSLAGVSMAEARRLRATLRGSPASSAGTLPATLEPQETVYAMPLGRVLLSGLFSFSLLWLAAIFGLLQTLNGWLNIDWREVAGLAERDMAARFTLSAAATVLAIALVLGLLSGVVRTLLRDFGFRLTHHAGRFRRVRGLFTRSEVVIADRRIQLATIRHGIVSGRLGWQSLEFQTLGGSNDPSGRQQIAPFATARETEAVLAAANLPAFDASALERVSSAHGVRAAIRIALPVAILFGIAGYFLHALWLGLLLVPVAAALGMLQAPRHRYAMYDASLQITRGVAARRDWIIPYAGVQSVTIRRGWLQRRLGVASVRVDTAGANGQFPEVADISAARARTLALGLLGLR